MSALRSTSCRILAALLSAVLVRCSDVAVSAAEPKSDAVKVSPHRTIAVTRADLVLTVAATGTVEPEETLDVGAAVAGQIVSLGADPRSQGKSIDFGSLVEKGTVLAQIEPSVYVAQVEQAQAGCARAKADLAQAHAALELAEIQSKRAAEQVKNKAISDAELDVAAAKMKLAKAGVRVAEASLAQSQVALKLAKTNLDYTTIKSPVKGIIIDRRVMLGQTVAPSLSASSLFLIAKDLAKLQVWASVNEADVVRIRPGQPVRFTVDAYPDSTFQGKVDRVRLNAQMAQNVVTYTVVVTTDNTSRKLLPYLTANTQFEVDRHKDVLLVPNGALRWRPRPEQIAAEARQKTPDLGRPMQDQRRGRVWVEDGAFVRPVDVRLGPSDGLKTEISGSGAVEGVEVIVGEGPGPPTFRSGSAATSQQALDRALASMGVNLLLVSPGEAAGRVTWGAGSISTLTPDDAREIARQCPAVRDAVPVVRGRAQITYRNRNWVPYSIMGTTPAFLAVRDWEDFSEGDMFADRDVRGASKVCVIGTTLRRELFRGESPIGKEIRIRNVPFRVVGVLSSKGANVMGLDQDDIVLAPWTTIKYRVSGAPAGNVEATAPGGAAAGSPPAATSIDQIFARAVAEKQIPLAIEQITDLLRQRHRIAAGHLADFSIRDMTELKKALLAVPRR
jgi:HlyD family secretion protein